MSVEPPRLPQVSLPGGAGSRLRRPGTRLGGMVAPTLVLLLALAARLATATAITFPIPEGSAYYVAAARNLATGHGLVVDVLWSYATPPLEVPRSAFDLWQPLAALLFAPAMALAGPTLAAAQAVSGLLGALAALAAWAIARDAARDAGLSQSRSAAVALAAGLAVAVTPLLVVQGAEPDSSAPFTVLALTACWLAPRALAERPPELRWRVLFGVALGAAYLARSEAIYLAIGFAALAWLSDRGPGLRRTLPAFLPAASMAAAWLLRQAVTWPVSPLGQLVENAWSVRATDIFAWSARPSLAAHLALGPAGLLGLRLEAILGSTALILLTAFPAALIGVAAVVARPRFAALPALRLLSIGAALTFAVDTLVFPVASRAGLYAHGAGPAVALLAILASLGLEALVVRLSRMRGWPPPRTAASPIALLPAVVVVALALPLTSLSAILEQERSSTLAAEYGALASFAGAWAIPADRPLVSDHPMWVNAALGRRAVVLPREDPAAIADLARHFGAAAVIVRETDSGDVAAALLRWTGPAGEPCFKALPAPPPFVALAFICLAQ